MRVVGVWFILLFTAAVARGEAPAIAHVETAGTGETAVVLIHNTQGDWRVWESFMERNADRYSMLGVRLAGAGGSEAMELPAGDPLDVMVWTDAAVGEIAAELGERGIERAFVVGHGLGAVIGMRLAIDHPGLVEGVVLVDAMPAYPLTLDGWRMPEIERVVYIAGGFAAATSAFDEEEWSERWSGLAARQVTPEDGAALVFGIAQELELPVWRRWTLEQHAPDLTDELRESGVRVLAMGAINPGKLNYFKTRTMVEEFWRLPFDEVPNAEVTFFDDTRHYIFLDRAEAFDESVRRFVEGETQEEYSYRATDEDIEEDAP